MTNQQHIANILGIPVSDCLPWCTWSELGADSLDVIDLVYKLEQRLGLKFPDNSWDKCYAVGDLMRLIERTSHASITFTDNGSFSTAECSGSPVFQASTFQQPFTLSTSAAGVGNSGV